MNLKKDTTCNWDTESAMLDMVRLIYLPLVMYVFGGLSLNQPVNQGMGNAMTELEMLFYNQLLNRNNVIEFTDKSTYLFFFTMNYV